MSKDYKINFTERDGKRNSILVQNVTNLDEARTVAGMILSSRFAPGARINNATVDDRIVWINHEKKEEPPEQEPEPEIEDPVERAAAPYGKFFGKLLTSKLR